ncbi:hypothetical protein M413DRAFT_6641 [Hebeloma cylindrosporum]|uniref:Uncharacterized protein n=1 Tax=Hebeloma cylindrosporum TaxID=76867 RepID=A0A0C3CZZ4_HEBCY|nr:hypothetical protein M413DRAFT_6641 [Hebeloma cylindrosporum h7]
MFRTWSRLSDPSKAAITREIASYVMQMRKDCVLHKIGALYHDSDGEVTIGPIVTQLMFMNGRRQSISRNRGPYRHDTDYVRAPIDVQIADVHFLNAMPSDDPNFNEGVFEDDPDTRWRASSLIPMTFAQGEKNAPFRTTLLHPHLSLDNTLWLTRIRSKLPES